MYIFCLLSLCLCVGLSGELWKSARLDLGAVWDKGSSGCNDVQCGLGMLIAPIQEAILWMDMGRSIEINGKFMALGQAEK